MFLLNSLEFSLPFTNPVLIFSLILFIILFAPILLNKVKIPHLLGLIIAGAIVGPKGLYIMDMDSSIILFGTVGLLYIMFLAGLEIDIAGFKKNSGKSLLFGLYTFSFPMIIGTAVSYYLLNFSMPASVLIASAFAGHTLLAYPIVSKLGLSKNTAVTITVGGTLIADLLSLLVLAGIAGLYSGGVSQSFWLQLGGSIVVFALIVTLLFPIIARWFFKRFDDNISQYIFVLAMVFMGAFLAEAAGVEGIIGAFLAGISLNRLIPHTSPLMNRIEFVGNALFIPFFLIWVGMRIDYAVFFKDLETITLAVAFTGIATSAKFIAAWLTQKNFGFSKDERKLIFGLSNARVAATLAVVLVGRRIFINMDEVDAAAELGQVVEKIPLFSESVLNATILTILLTCTIGSFAAQKGAMNIALKDAEDSDGEDDEFDEKLLIPVSNMDTIDELINLAVTVKSKKSKKALFALNVIDNNVVDKNAYRQAKKALRRASQVAAASDNEVTELLRYDLNIKNAISSVIKEHQITDLVLGLHSKGGVTDSYLGNLTEGILAKANGTTMIYKSFQPLATIKRHLIVLPANAEREVGFPYWLVKVWQIAKNTGASLVFYGNEHSIEYVQSIHKKHPVEASFKPLDDWDELLIIAKDVKPNDSLFLVMSRKEHLSYQQSMTKVPLYLNKYFNEMNFIMVYPIQLGEEEQTENHLNPSMDSFVQSFDKLEGIGKTITKLFKRNK